MLMHFIRNPDFLEAVQITKTFRFHYEDWPHWMHKAWKQGKLEDRQTGSLFSMDIKAPRGAELILCTKEGDLKVNWNDWLYYINGSIEYEKNEKFITENLICSGFKYAYEDFKKAIL